MTAFSWHLQLICLAALGSLLVYTLALVRLGRLSARVTVSWILADLFVMAAILLWGRLPLITYTSTVGDRELLVILAVVFFSYIAYLMLDSLQRISAQSAQITRLAQEIALLREGSRGDAAPLPRYEAMAQAPGGTHESGGAAGSPLGGGRLPSTLLTVWLIACFGAYAAQAYEGYLVERFGDLPAWVRRVLVASYQQ